MMATRPIEDGHRSTANDSTSNKKCKVDTASSSQVTLRTTGIEDGEAKNAGRNMSIDPCSSAIESLPEDLFRHVLRYLGNAQHRNVPACSTQCRKLWLMHAETEIRRLKKEFVNPIEFHGKSTTQRYYEIDRAVRRQAESLQLLDYLANNGTTVLDTINAVQRLLNENPLRNMEEMQVHAIAMVLSCALGYPSNEPIEDIALDHREIPLLKPMVEHVLARFERFKNRSEYRDISMALFLCMMKSSPPETEKATEVLQDVYAAEPDDGLILVQYGHHLVRLGRTQESFRVMQRAAFMPFRGNRQVSWTKTPGVCISLYNFAHECGIPLVLQTLNQVLGHLQEIDPTDEAPDENVTVEAAQELVSDLIDRLQNDE